MESIGVKVGDKIIITDTAPNLFDPLRKEAVMVVYDLQPPHHYDNFKRQSNGRKAISAYFIEYADDLEHAIAFVIEGTYRLATPLDGVLE